MGRRSHSTSPEKNVESLRDNAFAVLRRHFEGLTILYDKPIEHIQKTTTYGSREELINALMSTISSAHQFAIDINLVSVDEVRELYKEYQERRPDIFGDILSESAADKYSG